jgi:hypothetical protein
MRWALIFAWSVSLAAAADPDPAAVLLRVQAKVRKRADNLPNYTCVETVTRDYYRARATSSDTSCAALRQNKDQPRLTYTDRLRLDVSLTERGEIYSWAGASKFEDADISDIVRRGPIGTGSFGALLAIIFGLPPEAYQYEGRRGDLLEYSYRCEMADSRYRVKTYDSWVHSAYHGVFAVDPETEEVVRVSMETDELPASTASCRTGIDMEFAKVRIGDGEFLLPRQGQQSFIDRIGGEVRNATTFAGCREYRGDSTVTFFATPDAAAGKNSGSKPAAVDGIPERLRFEFELATPIAVDTAAAGDRFEGRLVSALRDNKGRVLAPAHARVEGRLLRVENHHIAPLHATLVLKLRTVEVGGVQVPIAAERLQQQRTRILMPYTWEQYSGVFELAGDHAVMRARTRSDWITRPAAK